MRTRVQITSDLLLLGLWIGTVLSWNALPDQIATHFGVSGSADAWTTPSLFDWLLLPVIATVTALFMRWMGHFVAANPSRMNVPSKARVMALPEQFRGPVNEVNHEIMAWIQLEVTLIMGAVQMARWVEATGGDERPWILAVLGIGVLSSPILIAVIFGKTARATDEAWKRARAAGHTEP